MNPNEITLSRDDATALLNLLRTVQMNLGSAEHNTNPVEQATNVLFSNEFAGELNQNITQLEGDIFGASVVVVEGDGRFRAKNAANLAVAKFENWVYVLRDKNDAPDRKAQEQFRSELATLVMLLRMAERGSGPEPSAN